MIIWLIGIHLVAFVWEALTKLRQLLTADARNIRKMMNGMCARANHLKRPCALLGNRVGRQQPIRRFGMIQPKRFGGAWFVCRRLCYAMALLIGGLFRNFTLTNWKYLGRRISQLLPFTLLASFGALLSLHTNDDGPDFDCLFRTNYLL